MLQACIPNVLVKHSTSTISCWVAPADSAARVWRWMFGTWRWVEAADTAREIRDWTLGERCDFFLGTEVRCRVAANIAGECLRSRNHDSSKAEAPSVLSNSRFRCSWWGVNLYDILVVSLANGGVVGRY